MPEHEFYSRINIFNSFVLILKLHVYQTIKPGALSSFLLRYIYLMKNFHFENIK